MLGLYEYDEATKDECFDDLYETLEKIIYCDDLDELESRAIRIQNIVKRLKELENEDND